MKKVGLSLILCVSLYANSNVEDANNSAVFSDVLNYFKNKKEKLIVTQNINNELIEELSSTLNYIKNSLQTISSLNDNIKSNYDKCKKYEVKLRQDNIDYCNQLKLNPAIAEYAKEEGCIKHKKRIEADISLCFGDIKDRDTLIKKASDKLKDIETELALSGMSITTLAIQNDKIKQELSEIASYESISELPLTSNIRQMVQKYNNQMGGK